jgi:hypothetical protein
MFPGYNLSMDLSAPSAFMRGAARRAVYTLPAKVANYVAVNMAVGHWAFGHAHPLATDWAPH